MTPARGWVWGCGPAVTPAALADVPKVLDSRGDSDGPRRGSLCDRHCAAINNAQGDLGDLGCHLHRPRVPAGRVAVGGAGRGALGVPHLR